VDNPQKPYPISTQQKKELGGVGCCPRFRVESKGQVREKKVGLGIWENKKPSTERRHRELPSGGGVDSFVQSWGEPNHTRRRKNRKPHIESKRTLPAGEK